MAPGTGALPQVADGVSELRRLLTDGPEPTFWADRTSVLVDPARTDLLLATVDTRPDADYTAVPYDSVRDLLSASRVQRSVVILDCCFSGRALESMGHLDGLAEVSGIFVLTATSGNAAAFAPADRPHSVFTGALVDVLANGEPSGSEYLTMDWIY